MECRTRIRTAVTALLALSLSGCAGNGGWRLPAAEPTVYPPDVFVHRVGTSHVVLYWNCSRPEAGVLRLAGVAQNPWGSQAVQFLELELVGVDSQDRFVSHAKGEARDILIRTNQTTPFQLDLRAVGSEVRYDLFYQYRFQEGEGRQFVAGRLVGERRLAQTQRFMARDVCSDTQHRVR